MKKFTLTFVMAIMAVPMMLAINIVERSEDVCETPSISYAITGYETATVAITNNEAAAVVVYEALCNGVVFESGSFTGDLFEFTVNGTGFYVIYAYATLEGKTDSPDGDFSFEIHEGEKPEEEELVTSPPTFHPYTEEGNIGYYFLEIIETEPSTIYYGVNSPDGSWSGWKEYEGTLSFHGNGEWLIEAYAIADDKDQSEIVYHSFVLGDPTGLSEIANSKSVANVRYYNMAGQEMQQPEGMTIVVTTYTDGITSATKVMK